MQRLWFNFSNSLTNTCLTPYDSFNFRRRSKIKMRQKGQKMDEFLRNVSDSWSISFFFFLFLFSNFFSKVTIFWFFDRISAFMSTSWFRSLWFSFLILSYAEGSFDPKIFISCGSSGTIPVVKIRGRHELKFGRYPVTNGFSNILIFRKKSPWAIQVERNFSRCLWRHLRRVSGWYWNSRWRSFTEKNTGWNFDEI